MEEVQSLAKILDNNLEMKELDLQLMTCSNCGEPIQKEIELLGKIRIVPRMCSCKKKSMEEKKKLEEIEARQDRIKQLFTNSLMDKKFLNETFENWDFSKGSKGMYNMGLKYCDKFHEIKKEGPITKAQKKYLSNLLEYHKLPIEEEVDYLTKNEASRKIDSIILSYGKIM